MFASDVFCINIDSTWKSDSTKQDFEIQTDPISFTENACQTNKSSTSNDLNIKNDVDANAETMTETNMETYERIKASYNNPKEEQQLLAALLRIAPLLEAELQADNEAFEGYDVNWDENVDTMNCTYILHLPKRFQPQGQDKKPLYVTDISWNSKGNVLSAAYGRTDQTGWCMQSGYVCSWTLFEDDFKQTEDYPTLVTEIEESYPTCLQYHPKMHNILAAGTYDGNVKVWKMQRESDSLLAQSTIEKYTHRDPVSCIQWIRNRLDDSQLIASMSGDGKIILWSMKNKLVQPIIVYTFTYPSKSLSLGLSSFSFTNIRAGSSLQSKLIPSTDDYFLFGTETGQVYKAVFTMGKTLDVNKLTKTLQTQVQIKANTTEFSYDGAVGYIHAVDCSPFNKNLFLTASSDGFIRLYNQLQSKNLITLQPCDGYVYDAAFSPFRPLVVASVCSNGHLYIYDLMKEDMLEPACDINISQSKPLTCLSFNPSLGNYIATGDMNGSVQVWQLPSTLAQLQPKEMGKLNETINMLSAQ